MNRKTLFMVVGLMVIALAVVGVGYGLWFEDLKIHGEVTTGELDIDFSPLAVNEYFEAGICDPDPTVEDTDLPDCPAKLEEIDCNAFFAYGVMGANADDTEEADASDPDYLGIYVDGIYPSYTCEVTFDITNAGNVPVHLYAWYAGNELPAGVAPLECTFDEGMTWTPIGADGWLPVQLHEGDSFDCRMIIHFENTDGLLEGAEYMFQYHIRACQWNEDGACTTPDFFVPDPLPEMPAG